MEQKTPRELVLEMIDAFNAHEADQIAELFANDGSFEDMPWGPPAKGKAEILAALRREFDAFPNAMLIPESLKIGDDFAIAEVSFTGAFSGQGHNFPPVSAGRCINVPGVLTFETAGGKLRKARFYHDTATEMRQMGMLPEQPDWTMGPSGPAS